MSAVNYYWIRGKFSIQTDPKHVILPKTLNDFMYCTRVIRGIGSWGYKVDRLPYWELCDSATCKEIFPEEFKAYLLLAGA